MQSSPEIQAPFNGIKGLDSIQRLFPLPAKVNGFNVIEKTRQELIDHIDDLKYFEGILYAYDGDKKGVRSQLRAKVSDSRQSIFIALNKLKAPSCLTERPEYDNTYDWTCEIEAWLSESGSLKVNVGKILEIKRNGNGIRKK